MKNILVSLSFAVLALVASVPSQVTLFDAGCKAKTGPVPIGSPRIGNLTFGVLYQAEPNTAVAFWFLGVCHGGSLPKWPSQLCGGGCEMAMQINPFPVLGAVFPPPSQQIVPLPIPAVLGLDGVEACMQFAGFTNSSCNDVSKGVKIRIHR